MWLSYTFPLGLLGTHCELNPVPASPLADDVAEVPLGPFGLFYCSNKDFSPVVRHLLEV